MSQFAWTFPGGIPKVDTIPATAGNASDVYTVPAGKVNWLKSIRIALTTDATVVNRYVRIGISDGTNELFSIVSDAIAASTTATKFFCINFTASSGTYNALFDHVLPAGYKLTVSINGGVAGDSFEGFTAYLEIDAP